jgi:hypothetical protein
MDMADGQREARSQTFLAEDKLKRLPAAGLELGDIAQQQARQGNGDGSRERAIAQTHEAGLVTKAHTHEDAKDIKVAHAAAVSSKDGAEKRRLT